MGIQFKKRSQNANSSLKLAGDLGDAAVQGNNLTHIVAVRSIARRSRDSAGNNRNSAKQIGTLTDNRPYRFRDEVGRADRNDYYTFTVGTRSNLKAVLSGVSSGPNLRLFGVNGSNLFRNNSKLAEAKQSIGYTRILNPGTYYIQVNQTTGRARYNLRLEPVSLVGNIENKGLSFLQNYPDLNYENGVNLYRYTKNGRTNIGIDPSKKTVVVVHGRGDSSEGSRIRKLLQTTARLYENQDYQVLALDWREPANDPIPVPFTAARSITPVAQWATQTLKNLGLTRNKITVFGHSLGAYVSAEIGREFRGVDQLVALDPAFPADQYDLNGNEPGDQKASDLKAVAKRSIALVVEDEFPSSDSIAGDNTQAGTAADSLLVQYNGAANLGATKAHTTVIDVFSNTLSEQYLKLENDLALPSGLDDVYNNSGRLVQRNGLHEGRVIATRTGKVRRLLYVERKTSSGLRQSVTWNR
ncbi:alpha/beta fold hydrolase [Microcoleus sp. FACHB-1515]|uniref:alpha/beta fold hydrolase n=1 Tax=Cyanophyceae TaxID=3028117 RepID=UPI0016884C50|nr:alpha/beta fold hydrolase [Microcoleus sp. FACHB-1515]MBD2093298.1 alpha/beta fold hydrolase [Microcoleus sp. FACHB-1515]